MIPTRLEGREPPLPPIKKRWAASQTIDLGPAVAPLVLIVAAYPALAVLTPGLSDQVLLATAILLAALSFIRYAEFGWVTLWLLMFTLTYAVRTPFGMNPSQGVVHTLALLSTGIVFLAFLTYGSEVMSYPGFATITITVLIFDSVVVYLAGLQKNAASSLLTYLCGFACVVALRRSTSTGLKLATAFYIYGIFAAFAFAETARALVVYLTVFIFVMVATTRMSARNYWLLGVAISSTVIAATLWFFVNVRVSPLASRLGHVIQSYSGERANTGRNFLWTSVLRSVSDNPIFGLGPGALPRDIVSTKLSSHNYYLQVYLQVGLLGLAILGLFLFSVWTLIAASKTTAGRFGSAIFLMFVLHNGTESLMFQNATMIAIPAWCSIGLALSIERSRSGAPGGNAGQTTVGPVSRPSRAYKHGLGK